MSPLASSPRSSLEFSRFTVAAWKKACSTGCRQLREALKPAESTPCVHPGDDGTDCRSAAAGRRQHRQRLWTRGRDALASSRRIAKIAFTGSTATGRVIAQAAANNLIPATLELGGKSPNIFFADVANADDFFDKAIEGLVLFVFNQGGSLHLPSRALIQESVYDRFMERALARVKAIRQGSPLDTSSMMGAQASVEQMKKSKPSLPLVKKKVQVLIGGDGGQLPGDFRRWLLYPAYPVQGPQQDAHLPGGDLLVPFWLSRHSRMKPRPWPSPTTHPMAWAQGSGRGMAARPTVWGVPSRAGRVWTNCYHAYPAHATFGGYKESGIGRETHKVMLDHYQQTKNPCELQPQGARLLLMKQGRSETALCCFVPCLTKDCHARTCHCNTPALALIERLKANARIGIDVLPVHGCCDGSAPMCYLEGELTPGKI